MSCKISCIVFSCTHPGHVPEAVIGHGVGLALLRGISGQIAAAGHGSETPGAVDIVQRGCTRDLHAGDSDAGGIITGSPCNVGGTGHCCGLAGHLADGVAVGVGDVPPPASAWEVT